MLEAAAISVSMDEPCWSLSEQDQMMPDYPTGQSWHRIQTVKVMRPGGNGGFRLASYIEDLGSRAEQGEQFCIPGGVVDSRGRVEILHTVGELRDIADQFRGRHEAKEIEPADLIGMYNDHMAERPLWKKRSSTFGPGGKTVRGFHGDFRRYN